MRERKKIRLKGYDYSQSGYYFVTICTKNREEWFGKVENETMRLSQFGEVAKNFWVEIPEHFKEVKTDEFSVMPNHLHGILIIEGRVGNAYLRSHQRNAFMHSLQDRTKMLLPKIIQQYKASVTHRINDLQNDIPFQWQKSFYDRVIQNENELSRIRKYIQNNPLKWDLDRENPFSKNFNLEHHPYWKEIYDWRRGPNGGAEAL
jgi:REP element-mobilizing transposase RayT